MELNQKYCNKNKVTNLPVHNKYTELLCKIRISEIIDKQHVIYAVNGIMTSSNRLPKKTEYITSPFRT